MMTTPGQEVTVAQMCWYCGFGNRDLVHPAASVNVAHVDFLRGRGDGNRTTRQT
jgi:hypothetical protein